MKILIAGAGIGGLTAALCLQKAGHQVQVFEQSAVLSELGAGLQCGANALRVLDYLGLMPALNLVAVAPLRADFRDYKTGDTLYSSAFGHDYESKHGAPYFHLHRADLQNALMQAVIQTNNEVSVQLNAQVRSYQQNSAKVTLKLTDGRCFDGDCLVGADGIKSVIRKQLLHENQRQEKKPKVSNSEPIFTGNVAWRGVLPVAEMPDNFMPKVVSNFVGPNKHMVIYYLRQQKLLNFVGVVENSQWIDDSWHNQAPWEYLSADFAGWHSTVQSVIDGMRNRPCYRWALYKHKPLNNWSAGRVTLLGDAAHSTLPFMASGAAMAIEDGRILQRALDQSSDVAKGLQSYQSNRMPRTKKIQNMSSKLGTLYHIKTPLLRRLAFTGLDLFASDKADFLPDYDANNIELS